MNTKNPDATDQKRALHDINWFLDKANAARARTNWPMLADLVRQIVSRWKRAGLSWPDNELAADIASIYGEPLDAVEAAILQAANGAGLAAPAIVKASHGLFARHAAGLVERGFSPIPRIIAKNGAKPRGHPGIKGWSDFCDRQPSAEEIAEWSRIKDADIALATGYDGLIAIDVDTDRSEVLAAVRKALPNCNIARYGSKGFALICRHVGEPFKGFNIFPADEDSKSPLVEVLGLGRNITIPPSLHAKTGQAYLWIFPETGKARANGWELPPLHELPVIDDGALQRLRETLEPWSRKPKPPRPLPEGPAPVLSSASEKRYRSYALAGLEGAAAALAGLRAGRPTELFRATCSLAWTVTHGVLSEVEFIAAFVGACQQNGLVSRDGRRAIEASVHSALRCAAGDPLPVLPDRPRFNGKKPGAVDREVKVLKGGASDAAPGQAEEAISPYLSEDHLALRFVEKHKNILRYVGLWGQWMEFANGYWRGDETLKIFDQARILCREIAISELNEESKQKSTASAKTIAAVEKLSRSDRRVASTTEQWDADNWLLNTPGGTVDLRTGELGRHNPIDYMSKITAVTPDANCKTPLWDRFLQTSTADDEGLARFLLRMAGYSLTGDVSEECLFFLYGTGGNGKGVFTGVLASILGEYHRTTPVETLCETKGDRHPTDLARLQNARLVLANETEEGRCWAEAKIKTLTGRDRIPARFMRQDFFEFEPKFKLIISGNHKPSLRNVDEAIRRRFHIIPFTVTIPKEDQDTELKTKLKAELPGILSHLIEGLHDYLERGLAPPKIVTDATAEYLASEDGIAAWRGECAVLDKRAWASTSTLYVSYKFWAEKAGERIPSAKGFSQALNDRSPAWGVSKDDRREAKGFAGIRIKNAEDIDC